MQHVVCRSRGRWRGRAPGGVARTALRIQGRHPLPRASRFSLAIDATRHRSKAAGAWLGRWSRDMRLPRRRAAGRPPQKNAAVAFSGERACVRAAAPRYPPASPPPIRNAKPHFHPPHIPRPFPNQDLATLDITTLTPLSPEVISRQATINIGAFVGGSGETFAAFAARVRARCGGGVEKQPTRPTHPLLTPFPFPINQAPSATSPTASPPS